MDQFSVGVAIDDAHGGGRLYIAPGSVVARPGPLGRWHGDIDAVELLNPTVEARPGWIFVRFDLRGSKRAATISVPRWLWPKVRAALQRSGVTVTGPGA